MVMKMSSTGTDGWVMGTGKTAGHTCRDVHVAPLASELSAASDSDTFAKSREELARFCFLVTGLSK